MSITATNLFNKIDRACGTNSTTYTLANKAIDINIAQDEVWSEALKNNGWNVDDFSQNDYPIITTDIVASQRDYSFILDSSGNRILDIYKVLVKDSSTGLYKEIKPVDAQSIAPTTMLDGADTEGVPTCYDKTGNGILLDLVPSTSITAGLKVLVNREPTYFTASDTTKVSGIDPLCQDYLYLKPSYERCRDTGRDNAQALFRDMQISWEKVKARYGGRERDIVRRMTPMYQNNH
jgi:hypothetical protein